MSSSKVAFVVCKAIGLNTGSASFDYIQIYHGDKGTLVQSLERIQRTAAEILEGIKANAKQQSEDLGLVPESLVEQ